MITVDLPNPPLKGKTIPFNKIEDYTWDMYKGEKPYKIKNNRHQVGYLLRWETTLECWVLEKGLQL